MSAPPSPVPLPPLSVGVRCDAGARMGVGHLIRSIALAEELFSRGHRVVVLGAIDGIGWLAEQLSERGLRRVDVPDDPAALAAVACDLGLDLVHLDGYHLDPTTGRALEAAGIAVSTSCDGEFGAGQYAQLHHDPNLGASAPERPRDGSRWLVGPEYLVLRDQVRRRARTGVSRVAECPRVLVVFGGSDPYGGAVPVVRALLDTGLAMDLVVPTARDDVAAELVGLPRTPAQTLIVGPVMADLPGEAARCDAVVSAAGSTVWELLCIGVPVGVVCVTENQRLGYEAVVAADVAVGVGELADLRAPNGPATANGPLRELILDASGGRNRRRDRGTELIDGDGRVRLVDALEELVAANRAR